MSNFTVMKDGKGEDVVYKKIEHPHLKPFYQVELFGSVICQIAKMRRCGWTVIVFYPLCEKHRNAPIRVDGFASRYDCMAYALRVTGIWSD